MELYSVGSLMWRVWGWIWCQVAEHLKGWLQYMLVAPDPSTGRPVFPEVTKALADNWLQVRELRAVSEHNIRLDTMGKC